MSPRGFERVEALDAHARYLLRERGRSVAATQAHGAADLLELLEVRGAGQTFALPLPQVEGITDLISVAAVPHAPRLLKGLVSFRGDVLPAFELGALVGGGGSGFGDLRRVLSLSSPSGLLALLAERTLVVQAASRASFQPTSASRHPFISGVDGRFVSLIDVDALITFALHSLEAG